MNNHIYRLVAGVSFILVLAFALFLPTMKTSSQAGAKCYRFYGVVKSHEDFHQVIDIEFYDGDTLLDRIQTQATTSSFASRYYRVYDEFRVVVTFNPAAADDDERVNLTYGPTADIECGI